MQRLGQIKVWVLPTAGLGNIPVLEGLLGRQKCSYHSIYIFILFNIFSSFPYCCHVSSLSSFYFFLVFITYFFPFLKYLILNKFILFIFPVFTVLLNSVEFFSCFWFCSFASLDFSIYFPLMLLFSH